MVEASEDIEAMKQRIWDTMNVESSGVQSSPDEDVEAVV